MDQPKRVLIVEDEPLIAMMIEDFVDILGHDLAGTADSVEKALPLVRAGSFDCAILDVHLHGGEHCWPIADALVATGKPFVLASGGSADVSPARHAGAATLNKPYTIEAVREALQRMG